MLLRLTAAVSDWGRLVAELEAEGSSILAGIVRSMLTTAVSVAPAGERVALAFTPAQAGALQRVGAGFGLELPATPVLAQQDETGWATSQAERAEAVAAAVTIIRTHQRLRFS